MPSVQDVPFGDFDEVFRVTNYMLQECDVRSGSPYQP